VWLVHTDTVVETYGLNGTEGIKQANDPRSMDISYFTANIRLALGFLVSAADGIGKDGRCRSPAYV
jgi:hypothetical protein